MADTKISGLTAATTPLAGTEVLPIVQSGVTKQVSVANLTVGRSVTALSLTAVNSGGKSTVAIGNTSSGTYSQLLMYGGSGVYNWSFGAQYNVGNAFEITPSTAVGGTTFSNPILTGKAIGGDIEAPVGNFVLGTAAKGVNFTANTPAAGMTSQLLNWYEEGTWTTTLGPGVTVNSGSWAATATYTRIGRTVFWNVVQTSGTITAAAGIEIFSGLPFAPARASSCTYTNSAVNLVGVGLAETNSKVYVAVTITSQTALRFSGTYEV